MAAARRRAEQRRRGGVPGIPGQPHSRRRQNPPCWPPPATASTSAGMAGAVWEPLGAGLPFNSKIAGLLTHSASPGTVFAVSDNASLRGAVQPPLILRSLDGGQRWASAAAGLPDVPATAWTIDPSDPSTLFAASSEQVFRSTDAGLSWQRARVESGARRAIAVAPSDGNIVYLGGRPAMRSVDRGLTWTPMPVILTGGGDQAQDVSGLVVAPDDSGRVWAALDGGGVFESRDAGRSWRLIGLAGQPVRWLAAGVAQKQAGGRKGRRRSMPGWPRMASTASMAMAGPRFPMVCRRAARSSRWWPILGRRACCGRRAMVAASTAAPTAVTSGRTWPSASARTWRSPWPWISACRTVC